MKTTDYSSEFKRVKEMTKALIKEITFSKMIADNIRDLIPKEWKLEMDGWHGDLRISPAQEGLTADKFDKLLKKLSLALRVEPEKSIDNDILNARIHLYGKKPDGYTEWDRRVCIEITAKNTESCEVVITRKNELVERVELTGYCKALSEKKYLEDAKIA
jgi:vacuolar-type H+-ATPase subunit C/Vma6